MSDQPDKALRSLLDTFTPGLSWLIRLISAALGVTMLSYVLPLVVLPILSTFILPSLSKALEPILSLFISFTEFKHHDNLYPQVARWMCSVEFHSWSSCEIAGLTEAFGYLWDPYHNSPEFVETEDSAYRGKIETICITAGQERFHFFRYQNSWFALYRDPHRNVLDHLSRNGENIIMYYMTWNRGIFENLLEDIQKLNYVTHCCEHPILMPNLPSPALSCHEVVSIISEWCTYSPRSNTQCMLTRLPQPRSRTDRYFTSNGKI